MKSNISLPRISNYTFLIIIVTIIVSSMPAFAEYHQSTSSSTINQTSIAVALNRHVAFGKQNNLSNRAYDGSHEFKVKRTEPEDDDLAVMALEVMLKEIDLTLGDENLMSQFENATEGQRAIYAVSIFQSEVNNDGFGGYFSHDAGNLIKQVKKGLVLIGARRYLHLLNKALYVFVDDEEMLDEAIDRRDVLSNLSNDEKFSTFEPLDSAFELLEYESLLQDSMNQFIENNQAQFFIKP
jgi:hypothetical protein